MIFTISVTSQVTNQGSPLSWKLLSDQDQIEPMRFQALT